MLLQITFVGLAVLAFMLFYFGTGKNAKVFVFGTLWIVISGLMSYSGFFQKTNVLPPRMIFILLPVVVLAVITYKKLNIIDVKPGYLIALHILRIPIELTLYQLFLKGKIPILMTFRGWNYDILIGISAIAIWGYYTLMPKRLNMIVFRAWNILGLLFLLSIVSIAILSAPSPIQLLAFDTPNLALITFPYTLLPAVIVPIVLLSHLLCLKRRLP